MQIFESFDWLHIGALKEKYGLKEGSNRDFPVLFWGCYGHRHLEAALGWKAKVLIYWCGGDILHLKTMPDLMKKLRDAQNITSIAGSNFIEADLKQLNLRYVKAPLFATGGEYHALPLGDGIYIYKPGSPYYCPMKSYEAIKSTFPDTPIYVSNNTHTFTRSELMRIYAKCFLGVRLTTHDGLSYVACELGLMGRKIIWNGDTPNALNYINIDEVIKIIAETKKNKYDPLEVSKQMNDYLNVELLKL